MKNSCPNAREVINLAKCFQISFRTVSVGRRKSHNIIQPSFQWKNEKLEVLRVVGVSRSDVRMIFFRKSLLKLLTCFSVSFSVLFRLFFATFKIFDRTSMNCDKTSKPTPRY